MNKNEIKRRFFEFFENKLHKIVSPAPIVNKDDPTLMFTNAGMNQFKSYFSDVSLANSKRVVDIQPCLRVSGKHNDLDDVGIDTYHNTMFEMMGSWSFGDYFKEEAISYAWDLLTNVYGIDKNRIYATTFGGDTKDNLENDSEAYKIWKNFLPDHQILNDCSKKDNFWEMGDMGPCGPCTELHVDLRSDLERSRIKGRDLVNKDHPEVVEIWNLVFIQFERLKNGSLTQLPSKSVDTGMGFERLAMVLQGKNSSYDTDVFVPLLNEVANLSGKNYGSSKNVNIAMRVVVDHIRSISFCIADGQLPSNNKAGYVVKRILRRAVRYGYSYLGLKEPFLHKMVAVLSENMGEFYPQIMQNKDYISRVIQSEENSFLQTLESGIDRLNKIFEVNFDSKIISGRQAFELYDTYGFPIDLTQVIARENNCNVDIGGFENELLIQKERSKSDAKKELGDWQILIPDASVTEFVGYNNLEANVKIVKYRKFSSNKSSGYHIVLDKTPFYPEGGGQIGDSGYLVSEEDKIEIISTKRENDLIIHEVVNLPKNSDIQMVAFVNKEVRKSASIHHTATHLLGAALKSVLGNHVEQKGSLVTDKGLRFDFLHNDKISHDELVKIERMVNLFIRENIKKLELCEIAIDKAKEMGATALFGEKYGDRVRVIAFDEKISIELCGGTHVERTGDVGIFKIVSTSGIAAGVRRIEACAGREAEKYIEDEFAKLDRISKLQKNPQDIVFSIEKTLMDLAKKQKDFEQLETVLVEELTQKCLNNCSLLEGNNFSYYLMQSSFLSTDVAKKLIKNIYDLKRDPQYVILLVKTEGGTNIFLGCDYKKQSSLRMNAKNIGEELIKKFGGKGGGTDVFVTIKFEKILLAEELKNFLKSCVIKN